MERSEQAMPMRLSAMRYGARDILLLELQPLEEQVTLPAVEAGAHLDVHLPGERLRQYSLLAPLCSAACFVIAVKREEHGRGGSRWLHDSARVGQVLAVGMPRNHFALEPGQQPVLLIAGGIGITPIYAMYQALRAEGRQVWLHYWSRSPEHALFRRQLAADSQVALHYSSDQCASLVEVLAAFPQVGEIYCCGPERMLNEVAVLAQDRTLHMERFQSLGPQVNTGDTFTVVLARSNAQYRVPQGASILEVLKEADVDVLYSCEQGVCGACEVNVLEGTPVHRDSVYSEQEHVRRKTMMICCSTASSPRLVLDL